MKKLMNYVLFYAAVTMSISVTILLSLTVAVNIMAWALEALSPYYSPLLFFGVVGGLIGIVFWIHDR